MSRISLGSIAWTFFRIGWLAFGGLGSALAIFQRDLVDRLRWLTASDVAEALAFTKPLPGSTVVQVVTFLGWRLRRWPGALVATVAFLTPATTLMTAGAAAAAALPQTRWTDGAMMGLQIAVVGLLASAIMALVKSEAKTALTKGVVGVAFVTGLFVNAAVVVLLAGILGGLRRHFAKP